MLTPPLPLVYTHVVNFYLAPTPPPKYSTNPAQLARANALYQEKKNLQDKIAQLSTNYSAESQVLLMGYAREALRALYTVLISNYASLPKLL